MIKKKELLDLMHKSKRIEELSIPIYSKHIESTLFFSGLSEDSKKQVKEYLTILREGSERHKMMLENLRKIIEKSDKDVF